MRRIQGLLPLLCLVPACESYNPLAPEIISARVQCEMTDYEVEAVVTDPNGVEDVRFGVVEFVWADSGAYIDEHMLEADVGEPGHWAAEIDSNDAAEWCSDDMDAVFHFHDAMGNHSWTRVPVLPWL